jgi:hypothetical protein
MSEAQTFTVTLDDAAGQTRLGPVSEHPMVITDGGFGPSLPGEVSLPLLPPEAGFPEAQRL